jgi:hypothetical protein
MVSTVRWSCIGRASPIVQLIDATDQNVEYHHSWFARVHRLCKDALDYTRSMLPQNQIAPAILQGVGSGRRY